MNMIREGVRVEGGESDGLGTKRKQTNKKKIYM
jgi:hypothetical protein